MRLPGADGGGGGNLPSIDSGGANKGQFLRVDPTTNLATWETLTQEMIQPTFAVSVSGPSSPLEVGATLINPQFTLSYNQTPSGATINDGTGATAVSSPFTSFTYAKAYMVNGVNGTVTWTVDATSASGSATGSMTVQWQPRVYYGTAAAGTYNAAYITALAGNGLSPNLARTIAFGAGGGVNFFNYAFPSAFGAPASFKDAVTGFGYSFTKVASGVNVTNGNGVTIAYDLWQSAFAQINATTIQVS